MTYIVYARKWRPQRFDEVIGQEHITTTLKNAIAQDRVAHAYIFCGPRGIGKTTTARILAKALNCKEGPAQEPCNKCGPCQEISEGRSLDVIEIDGASNRGIEEVRQLRENVKFVPSRGKFKIYIIDEVHMLTDPAFNALLKTLEEPPAHVKFVFATTQRHKVIGTILSRCQRFDFKRIPASGLVSKLKQIAEREKLQIEEGALFAIARAAEGSMRDAESILDQLASFCEGKIGVSDVVSVLGTVGQQILYEVTQRIIEKDSKGLLEAVNRLMDEGKDIPQLLAGLLEHFRNLVIAKVGKDSARMIDLSREDVEAISQQSRHFTVEDLLYIFNILSKTQESIKRSSSTKILLDIAMVKLTKRQSLVGFEEILQKISQLEERIENPKDAKLNESCCGEEPNTNPQTETKSQTSSNPGNKYESAADIKDTGLKHAEHEGNGPHGEAAGADSAKDVIQGPNNPSGAAFRQPHQEQITMERLVEIWPGLLERIKSEKMSAALFLSEGSPVSVEGAVVNIGFSPQFSFYSEVLERPENKKLMEKCLSEVAQKNLRVKLCMVHDGGGKFGSGSAAASASEDAKGRPREEAGPTEGEDLGGRFSFGRENGASEREVISEDNGPSSFSPSQLLTEPIIQSALKVFKGRIVKPARDAKDSPRR